MSVCHTLSVCCFSVTHDVRQSHDVRLSVRDTRCPSVTHDVRLSVRPSHYVRLSVRHTRCPSVVCLAYTISICPSVIRCPFVHPSYTMSVCPSVTRLSLTMSVRHTRCPVRLSHMMSVCLSVRHPMSVCLSVTRCPSVCHTRCPSVRLSHMMSVCMSVRHTMSVCPSVSHDVRLSFVRHTRYPSVRQSHDVRLSVCHTRCPSVTHDIRPSHTMSVRHTMSFCPSIYYTRSNYRCLTPLRQHCSADRSVAENYLRLVINSRRLL